MKSGAHPILFQAVAAILTARLFCSAAHGTDGVWTRVDSTVTNGSWEDSSNWLDGQIADGVDAIADFSTLDIGRISTVRLTGFRTVGTLKFQDAGGDANGWQLLSSFGSALLRLAVSTEKANIFVLNGTATIHAELTGSSGLNFGDGGGTGGRLILTKRNNFTGGVTISGGVLQLDDDKAAGNNTITVKGAGVETRLELTSSGSFALSNPIVIEAGATPGAGRGAVEIREIASFGFPRMTSSITIAGPVANGGHLFGGPVSSEGFNPLFLQGSISSSVPVVQAGGLIFYEGGGDFPALDVTGAAQLFPESFPAYASVLLATAGGGDGELTGSFGESVTLAGLDFGRPGSPDRGSVIASVALTGNLTTRGDATHSIHSDGSFRGALALGANHSIFTVADGARSIDLTVSASISGTAGFSKDGTGTLQLIGVVSNTGQLIVRAGTLAGTTTIAGPLTVAADGTIAPGANIGTMNTADVNFAGGSTFQLEIDSSAPATDLLASTGDVDLALATLAPSDLGGATLTSGERFTFITAGSVNGTFAGLPDGASLTVGASDFTIEYTPTSVALVAVPEPGMLASLAGGCGVLLGLRRFRR